MFTRKTVASLTGKLKTIIEDLKAHATAQAALADGHMAVASEYSRKAGDATQEAQKAALVASKLEGEIIV